MPPKASRRSSKTSIISVDPVVAKHIVINSKPNPGHARTESTPAQTLISLGATVSKGHSRTTSAPSRHIKKRSNSLRRVKNSTELLKWRSTNAEKDVKPQPDQVGSQRGRNFTVSNVAIGGLLQLSPSPHQLPFSPAVISPTAQPWMPPTSAPLLPSKAEIVISSHPQHSRTRSISPKRLLNRTAQNKTSKEINHIVHNRSQSFSTLDESRKSISTTLQPKILKIVINRPESAYSSGEEEDAAPTLEIPIPHYKLGTPRFSAHGTPFIRGSSFTRGSVATTTEHSSMTDQFTGPPPSSLKALAKLQQNQASEESMVPMPDPLRFPMPVVPQQPVVGANYLSPVSPDLYDVLLETYNDPSVVRFAGGEKEIAAATKVRIIAQISSESFMDYDLVSDFFLTFRSYMTTFEVLDYLLARLKWSVQRLSDDGRIIRIRTFAALRHWILNYFAEDFVINRHLRLRFCQEVNSLYDSVRQRPKGIGGVSDLKILQDLKRCWNGRCALYWDSEVFNMDSNQEEPLLPGGVIGSRNPTFADIGEATAALGLGLQEVPLALPSPLPSASSNTAKKTRHKRLPSSEYAKKPLSIESEHSLQAASCSLPRYGSRSPDKDVTRLERGPQPVSVLSRRHNAPSDLKVQVHTRSDNQNEEAQPSMLTHSSNERTPIEVLISSGHYVDPHAGSMIRGFVYGPVEPFIQIATDPPISPSMRFSAGQQTASSPRIPTSPLTPFSGPHAPAVKNIFGSIRRALSGRQSSNEITVITVSSPRPSPSEAGRRAPVPVGLARSSDNLKKRANAVPAKTQLRIDLLCAAAAQSFQTAVSGMSDATAARSIPVVRNVAQQLPFSPPLSLPDEVQLQGLSSRFPSHYTAQSGSILIVDDTAVAMPVMSGALQDSPLPEGYRSVSVTSSSNPVKSVQRASFATQIAVEEEPYLMHSERRTQVSSVSPIHSPIHSPRLFPPAPVSPRSKTESAVTVQKVGLPENDIEDEGSVAVYGSQGTGSPPSMTEATSKSESPVSKPPAHGLRRRPGGDLKMNQNVQDLEAVPNHQSLDSMLASSSHAGSVLMMSKSSTANNTPERRKKSQKVSMINTHSSQHLRPSFEAAVAGFSAIPDDDDGGLEATLLKLEGRYEDRSPDMSHSSVSPTLQSLSMSEQPASTSTNPTDFDAFAYINRKQAQKLQRDGISFLLDENVDADIEAGHSQQFARKPKVFGLPTESHSGSDSEESEVSLPILNDTGASIPARYWTQPLIQPEEDDDARSSSDILENKPHGGGNISRPDTAHTEGERSFLLDEHENMSDLSSEISVDIVNYSEALGKPISPMLAAPGTAISGLEIPTHPLTHASMVKLPIQTSPSLALGAEFSNAPPTPQQSPHLGQTAEDREVVDGRQYAGNSVFVSPQITTGPAHVPFVLACDSQVLAQQFTIVEQSALTEVEWTDLVDMRWNNKSTNVVDWAEYMAKHDDARGIDVVISRFNLVVKWTLSEIVLTQNIAERARVLSKLIHVAAHARRLHNYATMLQLTIALMSTSCTRLKKTWDLVPGPDKSLLKHMENLAQPIRNFHDLRVEMESTDLSTGCIPFIGLYVHDLTYNAQKPIEIHVEEGSEALINFERFRTAAIIIKGLLRLIDASLRYDFEPVHGIIERCLWMSALPDERIDALSRVLES